jgi:hypothetical protein
MVAKNDITGDSIRTRNTSKAYSDNYELIWGKKDKREVEDSIAEDEEFNKIDDTKKQ